MNHDPSASGRARSDDAIDLAGHVIVCGLGGVGLRTVEQLHLAGVPVLVVDDRPDPRLVRILAAWGITHVTGNARLADVLLRCGLRDALAVICVENEELLSLEIALLVHDLQPQVRVVIQLANAAVGQAVVEVTGRGSVLDVAELAAPSVVEACLASRAHPLSLDGDAFVVLAVTATSPSTLREQFGDLAPVAVVGHADGAVAVCPGRDQQVRAGDTVHLLGTPEQFDALGLIWRDESDRRTTRSWMAPIHHLRVGVLSIVSEAERGLRLAVAALLLVVAVSTIVLMIGYRKPTGAHMSALDGIYFSVETVATIGYGDFSFADQSTWLRIYAIGLMVAGVVLATIFFALLTNLLVSRRLEESLGRRHVTNLSDHVVIVGLGSIGLRVVERILGRGVPVVVIERDENNRYLAQARALGIPVVIADSTLRRTLQDVNVPNARALAVLTSNDLTNIETALAIRDTLGARWDTVPVVVRLFDRQLASTIERTFGFRHVRSTAALAAPWFVGAALGLDVISTFSVQQQPFLLARLQVAVGGGLDGLPMAQLSARTRVVAIRRRDVGATRLEHPPRRDTRFAAHDIAYLIGPYEELLNVLRHDVAPARPARDPAGPA